VPKAIRMNWARRLNRALGVEIERCVRCGGRLKVIASIEEPEPMSAFSRTGGNGVRRRRRRSRSGHQDMTPIRQCDVLAASTTRNALILKNRDNLAEQERADEERAAADLQIVRDRLMASTLRLGN
jgi:hypothetical protein